MGVCIAIGATTVGTADAQQIKKKLTSPSVSPRTAAARLQATAVQAPFPLANTFLLHSNPAATKTIYLDFDGNTTANTAWNTGSTSIITAPFTLDSNSSFSSAELSAIQEIWQRVAECYSPFNVDVTTEAPAVDRLVNSGGSDTRWGVRVCIGTSTPSPAPDAGGVAFIGSFSWNSDTPCFVFPASLANTSKFIADASVHEVGHTLGLSHDGRISPAEGYYYGHGTGLTGWAPHMGVGYDQNLVQWSKGEYLSANNQEDHLAMITTLNGFGYKTDDFANDRTTALAIAGVRGSGNQSTTFNVNQKGLITLRTDTDWFKLTVGSGPLSLSAVSGGVNTMLDIQMDLYSSTGSIVATSNPADLLNASISQNVSPGTYYVKIDGVGKGDPLATGYTDYSSIGTYAITGTFVAPPNFTSSVVAAVYSPTTKTLKLTGDAEGNSVTVSLQAGSLKIEGANGTSIEARTEAGVLISKSSAYTVSHSGKLILNAVMNGGDDALSVVGVDSSTTTIELGAGADKASFVLSNFGTLKVDGGAGTDIMTLTSSTYPSSGLTTISVAP